MTFLQVQTGSAAVIFLSVRNNPASCQIDIRSATFMLRDMANVKSICNMFVLYWPLDHFSLANLHAHRGIASIV